MKWIKSALLLTVVLGLVAEPAWADRVRHGGGRSRAHVGVVIGAPLLWPYYPGPYYYPPVIAMPSSPPVYIEQEPVLAQQYWYFCRNPQGYYPYVKQCLSGWLQVVPQPPAK